MQSMDRNTVIGFVLLAILLFAYLFISSKNSRELEAQKKRYDDSVSIVSAQKQALNSKKDSIKVNVTAPDTGVAGIFNGAEKTITVENEVLKITFTNKGAQPQSVYLKKYRSADSSLVQLENSATDDLSYAVNTEKKSAQTSDLFFNEGSIEKKSDGSQVVTFQVMVAAGENIIHQYTIKPNSYLVDWNVQLNGADKLLTQNALNVQWKLKAIQHEKYTKYERQQSQIIYLEDGGYDYNTLLNKSEKKFDKPLQWLSIKQQFFNTTLVAKNKFDGGQIQWTHSTTDDTTNLITQATASFNTKVAAGSMVNVPMQVYYGPNDYKILRNAGVTDMDKIINLGQGMYAFVRPINQFIIMPVFNFFKSFIGSYGLVIALLTIFIRLVTSPLVYTSYLSGAKMKALRPELDILKKKFPDQQQFGMEQMKLFREVGVNPLGGCIPALLQIPIFFALYSLFNSSLALRGENFLWAKDLSTYDVIAKLPFTIPAFGDHISLFTITAVATSFLISIYNMNMTPDQSNPALKYMPYIFPFVLLFIFNSLPAALTWYYTVSNLITLMLQWVIQNYIIDHSKILLKLEENKKKPKTKSKWQERLEQMQQTQKKVQDIKSKPKR